MSIVPYQQKKWLAKLAAYGGDAHSSRMRMRKDIAQEAAALVRVRNPMLFHAAKFAYDNRRSIKRAGVFLASKAKRRMFSADQIGMDPDSSNSRSYTTINNITKSSYNSKVLHVRENLVRIPEATDFTKVNLRQGELLYLSGIKLCMQFRANTARPLCCNLAVLTPREGRYTDAQNANAFFRNHADASRNVSFSGNLSGNEMHCLPINPDKYIIHWHYRFTLGKAVTSGAYNTSSDRNYINIHRWIPIKRQIRYSGSAANDEAQRLPRLFFWCNEFMDDAGTPGENNAVTYMERCVAYFRNSRP